MGADGHIVITSRLHFEKANPGVRPEWLHLYTGKVLGIEACWGYWGDNLDGSNYVEPWLPYKQDPAKQIGSIRDSDEGEWREATPDEVAAILKAAEWFERNAEQHEVWT